MLSKSCSHPLKKVAWFEQHLLEWISNFYRLLNFRQYLRFELNRTFNAVDILNVYLLRESFGNTVVGRNFFTTHNSGVSESLQFAMPDEKFGYMTAYYDNRSHAVVVVGKGYFAWENQTSNTLRIRPAICDFRSSNGTLLYSVPLHYFTTYLFYCNLTRPASTNLMGQAIRPWPAVPEAISLRLIGGRSFNQTIPVRMPPSAKHQMGRVF